MCAPLLACSTFHSFCHPRPALFLHLQAAAAASSPSRASFGSANWGAAPAPRQLESHDLPPDFAGFSDDDGDSVFEADADGESVFEHDGDSVFEADAGAAFPSPGVTPFTPALAAAAAAADAEAADANAEQAEAERAPQQEPETQGPVSLRASDTGLVMEPLAGGARLRTSEPSLRGGLVTLRSVVFICSYAAPCSAAHRQQARKTSRRSA